jgi:hypothetical protein
MPLRVWCPFRSKEIDDVPLPDTANTLYTEALDDLVHDLKPDERGQVRPTGLKQSCCHQACTAY